MRILITGGSGFIGGNLFKELSAHGHEPVAVSRRPGPGQVGWEELPRAVEQADAVVNLAGASIADGRWTDAVRERILQSRVEATRSVVAAIDGADKKPGVLVQGSAVGYYGPGPEGEAAPELDEAAPPGRGFLAEVAQAWEAESRSVMTLGVRLATVRTGVVLGLNNPETGGRAGGEAGGVLAKFLTPFKLFVGGPLGSGRQWMSWVHMADQVGAIRFLLEREDLSGPYNLCAPNPATMAAFARALGKKLNRPSALPVPGFLLKTVLGEMAEELILSGQRAVPAALVAAGYSFRFPELDAALHDLVNDPSR